MANLKTLVLHPSLRTSLSLIWVLQPLSHWGCSFLPPCLCGVFGSSVDISMFAVVFLFFTVRPIPCVTSRARLAVVACRLGNPFTACEASLCGPVSPWSYARGLLSELFRLVGLGLSWCMVDGFGWGDEVWIVWGPILGFLHSRPIILAQGESPKMGFWPSRGVMWAGFVAFRMGCEP